VSGFDWRRPPVVVHVEQSGNGPTLGEEDIAVNWVVGGEVAQQQEDADRMARGLVCANCLEPFPAKPSLETLPFFREVWQDKPEPFRSQALARVAVGCCTACGCSIDDAMYELFHGGEEPAPERPS
jgi:hypothetical protein